MMHPGRKPVGFFLKDNILVAILPHDKEEAAAAVARVTADWGVDPTAVTPTPPKPAGTATEYSGVEVVCDRHLPPRDFKPKAWAGKGASSAVDGVKAYYEPPPPTPTASPLGVPPSTPKMAVPVDYAALLSRPSE
jgi:hypothetical protein